jgi:hypothetical protein
MEPCLASSWNRSLDLQLLGTNFRAESGQNYVVGTSVGSTRISGFLLDKRSAKRYKGRRQMSFSLAALSFDGIQRRIALRVE